MKPIITTHPIDEPAPWRIIHGDCIEVMRNMAADSVDMIVTDPPYLVSYRDRAGRSIANDNNPAFVAPALLEMGRLLAPHAPMVLFCGWAALHEFAPAWAAAGLRVYGQLVFIKRYASSVNSVACRHESAFLLAKRMPRRFGPALPDVLTWHYSGNKLHPTEKAVDTLTPLIRAFCRPGGLVLDPFCGSGSSLAAAIGCGHRGVGIEIDAGHVVTARNRLEAFVGSP